MRPRSLPPTAPELFEAQARRTPSALALLAGSYRMTYAQLNGQANRLARSLVARGARPGTIVAVAATRRPQAIISILAALKAGAAYLPLDPCHPRDRLDLLLRDAKPMTVLVTADMANELDVDWPRYCVDAPAALKEAARYRETDLSDRQRLRPLRSADPAYLIYTSGSAGQPKGVLVPHRGIPYLAASQVARFRVTAQSRVLQFAPLTFDASVSEIWMALSVGACLVVAPPWQLRPGQDLARLAEQSGVTHLTLPPSALAAMPAGSLADVRTLVVAGEACPPALVAQWSPGRRMINAYGPTETTVCATISKPLSGAAAAPLGSPVLGSAVYVLDEEQRECPPEVPGELCVAGQSLALGYLGRPDLTAQRFAADPFGTRGGRGSLVGGRMYRTGDLAVRRADGSLHYLGRGDGQVKVRGVRVEPGEVEQVLLGHPAVVQAAVLARPDPSGAAELVGFAALVRGADTDAGSLRGYLGARLPRHLVPSRVTVLPALPVTGHGKVDRGALLVSASTGGGRAAPDPGAGREADLAALFAEVLGEHPPGPDASFFDLGGHSLSAARLVTKINEAFRAQIELDDLYECPTLATMAKLLSQPSPGGAPGSGATGPLFPHLVRLGGSGPDHVFCVHAVDGGISRYRELARQLADAATVYGITAIDLDRRTRPQPVAAAIAASYLDGLLQVQPTGPYHLAGWSSGGQLAYEMACQLSRQGQQIGSVTVLDALRPDLRRSWRRYDTVADGQWTTAERIDQWRYFLSNLFPRFDTLEIADPRHEFWAALEAMTERNRREAVVALARDAAAAGPQLTADELGYVFDVVLALDCAAAGYQASRYPGPVDLYVTDVGSRRLDTVAYWESLPAGTVISRHIPGDHTAVVEMPGVAQVAETIRTHLRP